MAIRIWLEQDEELEWKEWGAKAKWMVDALRGTPNVSRTEVVVNERRKRVRSHIFLDEDSAPSAADVVLDLRKGDPSIWVNCRSPNEIVIETQELMDGEERVVVSALKKRLTI